MLLELRNIPTDKVKTTTFTTEIFNQKVTYESCVQLATQAFHV